MQLQTYQTFAFTKFECPDPRAIQLRFALGTHGARIMFLYQPDPTPLLQLLEEPFDRPRSLESGSSVRHYSPLVATRYPLADSIKSFLLSDIRFPS